MEQEIIFRKSFVFALDIIQYSELLEKQNKHSVAEQLVISGTAFGENINDVRHAENDRDYIESIKKANKNAQKIKYWLQLCKYSNVYPSPQNLITEIENLIELINDSSFIINQNQ